MYATKRTAVLLALVALLLIFTNALAMDSTNYILEWFLPLTSGGGGVTSSTNYSANFTIGQSVVRSDPATSTSYNVCLGYWCGITDNYKTYLPFVGR